MSSPEPAARIDLPFAPGHLLWGADGTQMLVAGGTHPVTSVSIRPGSAEIGWTGEGEFPGATVKAVAAGPGHGLVAVAETVTVPPDPEPIERLRVLDLETGRRRWFRNYELARRLAFSADAPALLLSHDGTQIKIWDLGDPESAGAHTRTVGWSGVSPSFWKPGPGAYGRGIVVGSPPTLINVATGDSTPLELPEEWEWRPVKPGARRLVGSGWFWIRIAWAGDRIVALGRKGHPGGKVVLATLSARDGTLGGTVEHEWTVASGAHLDIAASPDGGRLAYTTTDRLGVLTLPDLEPAPGFRPLALPAPPDDHRRIVRFSPGGDAVAVDATRAGPGVTLVDAANGECLWQYAAEVDDLDFSPSGRRVVVREGTRLSWYDVALVSSESWTRKKHWPLPGTPHAMAMTTIQPEGKSAWPLLGAVGTHHEGDGLEYFRRVDNDEGKREFNPTARPVGLAFGRDLYLLWHAGGDNALACRNLIHEERKKWTGSKAATAAAFVKDDRVVAVRGDNLVRFHEIDESESRAVELRGAVRLLAIAPGAPVIAVAGHNRTWLLDPEGRFRHEEPIGTSGDVTALAFDRKSARLLIAHRNSAVAEVDLESGAIVREHPHEAPVRLAVVHPGGGLLATAAVDNTVRLIPISAGSGKPHVLSFDHPVRSVALHPRDRVVVVATEEPHLAMFDLDDGHEYWWTPLPAPVHDVAISDDGDVIAVACDDGIHFYGRRR